MRRKGELTARRPAAPHQRRGSMAGRIWVRIALYLLEDPAVRAALMGLIQEAYRKHLAGQEAVRS